MVDEVAPEKSRYYPVGRGPPGVPLAHVRESKGEDLVDFNIHVDVCHYLRKLNKCAHQYGLADTSYSLAGSRCGKVYGQVRQAQNRNQR